MTNLTNGENVKWQHEGGWQTGNVVRSKWGATVPSPFIYQECHVLVALTHGGLAFVPYSSLERIPDRED